MKIRVIGYGTIVRRLGDDGEIELEIPQDTEVNRILEILGITKSEAGIISFNGKLIRINTPLSGSGDLIISNQIGGG